LKVERFFYFPALLLIDDRGSGIHDREVLRFLKEAGFGQAEIRQALIPGEPLETIRDGFGAGAFFVIRSEKPEMV